MKLKDFKKFFEDSPDTNDLHLGHGKCFSEGISIISKYLKEDDVWFGEEICLYGDIIPLSKAITIEDATRLAQLGWFIEDERSDSVGHLAYYS